MKFSMLALTLIILASSAFAQERRGGTVVLRDGRTVVRINVGDDRDDRDQLKRIHRLEQAVRDLQDQVYQLQLTPVRHEIQVCSGDFFSVGLIVAKAASETEARGKVISECQRKGGGIFCRDKDVKCEPSVE